MVRRAIPGDRLLVVLPGVGGASRAPFHVQIHERLPLRNGRRGRAVGRLSGLPAGGRRNADPAIRILVKRLGAGGRPQQQKHARSLVPGRFLNARSAGVAPTTPGNAPHRDSVRAGNVTRRHCPPGFRVHVIGLIGERRLLLRVDGGLAARERRFPPLLEDRTAPAKAITPMAAGATGAIPILTAAPLLSIPGISGYGHLNVGQSWNPTPCSPISR
jgi:hypothetical protein